MKTHLTHLILLILLSAACLAITGCTGPDEQADAPAAETPAPTNRIDVPAVVRKNLGITFAKVERRAVANTIRVPGRFELQPLARHEYRMTLAGRVELVARQYQPVEAGDLLYRYHSPQWPELQHEIILGEQAIASARAEIEVAKAKLDEANSRLGTMRERIDALAAADFRRADIEAEASQLLASLPRLKSELTLAETKLVNGERTREHALHRAAVTIGATEADLLTEIDRDGRSLPRYRAIDWIDVRAIRPGIVEMLSVTDGAYVEPPSVVLSTVDLSKLRFMALGLQSDLARFSGDRPARIVPPRSPGLDMTESIEADLVLGLVAHPDERTISLVATPKGSAAWTRPGVSAFLEVVVKGTGGPALAIPRSAVVKDGTRHVFFRRDPNDPDKVIRVEADLGVDDGRWVALNSGVRLGDEIVLDGSYELNLASAQHGSHQKGGHFHADGTFHAEDH